MFYAFNTTVNIFSLCVAFGSINRQLCSIQFIVCLFFVSSVRIYIALSLPLYLSVCCASRLFRAIFVCNSRWVVYTTCIQCKRLSVLFSSILSSCIHIDTIKKAMGANARARLEFKQVREYLRFVQWTSCTNMNVEQTIHVYLI